MDVSSLIRGESGWWWILPVLVFVARVVDVSLGTLRILFVSRGLRMLAPVVGFFEVLIWIAAIAQVVSNLHNVAGYFAYAAGFALGTYVGLRIEERLALGTLVVRIITQLEGGELVADLRRQNFGVTCIDAQGSAGPVKVIYTIVRRADLSHVLKTLAAFNPNAFYTIEDVRAASRQAFRRLPPRRRPPEIVSDADIARMLAAIERRGKE